jgi:hypothetical protein
VSELVSECTPDSMVQVAAHKAAGHERKAINWIMKRKIDGLSAPLMTLVDFRGERFEGHVFSFCLVL